MQVWASVNEADIAKVTPGTKVHFRVDALPNDTFHGVVVQRRLNAQMTQNVVIYTVVISVDNSELKLLPYLTADVYFEVDSRKDALLVSNAALRYKPTPELIDSESMPEESGIEDRARRRARVAARKKMELRRTRDVSGSSFRKPTSFAPSTFKRASAISRPRSPKSPAAISTKATKSSSARIGKRRPPAVAT